MADAPVSLTDITGKEQIGTWLLTHPERAFSARTEETPTHHYDNRNCHS